VNQEIPLSSISGRKILGVLDNFHDSIFEMATLEESLLTLRVSSPYSYPLRQYVETVMSVHLQVVGGIPEQLLSRSDTMIAGISIIEDDPSKFTLGFDDGSDYEFLIDLMRCTFSIDVSLVELGIT
jgi:hypothetical protein